MGCGVPAGGEHPVLRHGPRGGGASTTAVAAEHAQTGQVRGAAAMRNLEVVTRAANSAATSGVIRRWWLAASARNPRGSARPAVASGGYTTIRSVHWKPA